MGSDILRAASARNALPSEDRPLPRRAGSGAPSTERFSSKPRPRCETHSSSTSFGALVSHLRLRVPNFSPIPLLSRRMIQLPHYNLPPPSPICICQAGCAWARHLAAPLQLLSRASAAEQDASRLHVLSNCVRAVFVFRLQTSTVYLDNLNVFLCPYLILSASVAVALPTPLHGARRVPRH